MHNIHLEKNCAESFLITEARLQSDYITEIHQNHRITEWLGWKGSLWMSRLIPPLEPVHLKQIVQGCIHLLDTDVQGFEHLQRSTLLKFYEQSVPVFCHSQSK